MKSFHKYGLIPIILILAVAVFYGCSDDAVVEPSEENNGFLAAVNLRTSDVGGVDIGAIAAPFDAGEIAEAVRASERSDAEALLAKNASVVGPGESIQAAVDAAEPGSIVFVRPGVYEEVVIINKSLHLVGLGKPGGVVIQDPGSESNGIYAMGQSGISLINLTVRGFSRNGVFFVNVDGFLMYRLFTDQLGEGAYGLFPVRSRNGLIAHCTATGADDAGIYVGQSENVAVVHNEAYGNVIGLEAENVKRTLWAHNHAYDNAAGMLAILLPPTPPYIEVTHAEQLYVEHNRLTSNNGDNFAEEGDLASFVPSGTGLLVIGYDDSVVRHNRVTGNAYIGLGLGSSLTMLAIAGRLDNPALSEIEPHPDDVRIIQNRVTGNGFGEPTLDFPPVDLLWDQFGTGNCWDKNTYASSYPEDLPSCN